MMTFKTTQHFSKDRATRAAYIAEKVGFGEFVYTVNHTNKEGKMMNYRITETGVLMVFTMSNEIVTMYLLKAYEIKRFYGYSEKTVPAYLLKKAMKNEKNGYIRNQPDHTER